MAGNLLVTSIGAKVPLLRAARNALTRVDPAARLVGADLDGQCIGRWFVDVFWKTPPLEALAPYEMVEFCRRHEVRWLIPTRDAELPVFSRWVEEDGIDLPRVLVPSSRTAELCGDKLRFARALADRAPVIPTWDVLPERPPERFPADRWVVKERRGAGSRRIYLDVARETAREVASGFSSPVFQPYVSGVEYSVDLYLSDKGEPWGCVVRRREVVVDGESQVTVIVSHPDAEKCAMEVAAAVGLRGCGVVQLLEDEEGRLFVVECNPRFGGATTLSVAAGLDVFFWFLRESEDPDFRPGEFVRGRPGLRQVRHKCDFIVEPSQ